MKSSTSPLAISLQWLLALLMPIFLTLLSLYIFMTPQFAEWQYARSDFPHADRFSDADRLRNSLGTIAYVRGETSEQDLINLGVYNDREIKHLVDVYNVSHVIFILEPIFFLVLVVGLFLLWRKRATRVNAANALFYGGIFTFIFIGAIGLFSLFAFDNFFVTFHRIFFSGDSWLFFTTDSLIQFYPEVFWMTAAYGIALFVLLCAVLVTAVGAILMRRRPFST
jgi:integral membrane protein (TIGR01906 family)